MMFGEVDTDALSPQCGEPDQPQCPVGYWIIPITWVVYMMVANILIVNVLIAVFNGIYSEIDAVAVEVNKNYLNIMSSNESCLITKPNDNSLGVDVPKIYIRHGVRREASFTPTSNNHLSCSPNFNVALW